MPSNQDHDVSAFENAAQWAEESFFRWARHGDSADAFWHDGTDQVRALVKGLMGEVAELRGRFEASKRREKTYEAEIERLKRGD